MSNTCNTCNAAWTDELNPSNDRTVLCNLGNDHDGPHHNTHHGLTWGNPNEWFDNNGDAA